MLSNLVHVHVSRPCTLPAFRRASSSPSLNCRKGPNTLNKRSNPIPVCRYHILWRLVEPYILVVRFIPSKNCVRGSAHSGHIDIGQLPTTVLQDTHFGNDSVNPKIWSLSPSYDLQSQWRGWNSIRHLKTPQRYNPSNYNDRTNLTANKDRRRKCPRRNNIQSSRHHINNLKSQITKSRRNRSLRR